MRPPDTRRGAPGQEPLGHTASAATKLQVPAQGTADTRQKPTLVGAEVRVVVGRLRERLELFVRCPKPGCRGLHQHRADVSFMEGVRTAPCGQRYTVVAGIVRAAVAS